MAGPRRAALWACVAALAAVSAPAAWPAEWPRLDAWVQAQPQEAAPAALPLPNGKDSLKFFVLGDFGTGGSSQYELAERMARVRERFPAELVITVGDNIYGGERPQDFRKKFEDPYKPLLDAGVEFRASLGNHDSREQARYGLFNMEGRTYYSFKAPKQNVKFVALETDYPTPKQIEWLTGELEGREDWIIPYFHHPLYSSGKRHGSHLDLREVLEPLFIGSRVSVVFAGHDHFYERTKPQHGIVHFVVGSGGQLRRNGYERNSPITAAADDTARIFLAAEIDGDSLHFAAIDADGRLVDAGVITRRSTP